MKRILSTVVIFVLVLSLAACGSRLQKDAQAFADECLSEYFTYMQVEVKGKTVEFRVSSDTYDTALMGSSRSLSPYLWNGLSRSFADFASDARQYLRDEGHKDVTVKLFLVNYDDTSENILVVTDGVITYDYFAGKI